MTATSTQTHGTIDPACAPSTTILLVEDDELLAHLFVRVLRGAGFGVRPCRTGLEALLLLKTENAEVDLVLSDIRLPLLGGDALAMEIRRIRPWLPVLLMTGFSERVTPGNASFFGVARVLQKPIAPRELLTAIDETLSRAREGVLHHEEIA